MISNKVLNAYFLFCAITKLIKLLLSLSFLSDYTICR